MDRRLLFLLQRASRAALARTNALLADRVEISVAQLATLSYVTEHDGCTSTDVAAELDLNKSAVSTMLGRLERAGLVRREPNPDDARGTRLHLTARGDKTRKDSRPAFRAAVAEMTEGFTPAELDVVLRFLNAVVERCGNGARKDAE
jgi:DNA-binding MarR family transcriptional regulator